MHLVYRALEKEPVPALLPPSLVPLSKRKKSLGSVGTSVPGLPASPPPPKDSLRSTPSHGSMNSLNSAGSLSPKHTLKSGQVINTHLSTCLPTYRIWDIGRENRNGSNRRLHMKRRRVPSVSIVQIDFAVVTSSWLRDQLNLCVSTSAVIWFLADEGSQQWIQSAVNREHSSWVLPLVILALSSDSSQLPSRPLALSAAATV